MQIPNISNDTIIPIDEFHIDYSELIQDDAQGHITEAEEYNHTGTSLSRISLPPNTSHHNQVTNELFQVTNRESWNSTLRSREGINNFLFGSSALKNDKVKKMMQNISCEKEKQLEENDYELDDVVRVGFYRGNIRRQFNVDNNEKIDKHMDNYLGPSKQMNQENKENQYPEPLKAKRGFSITKHLSNRNTSIPILKPIHQNAKTQKLESFLRNSLLKSPKRVCSPSHRIIAQPGKSVLRRNGPAFVVESSTGLINEATKFGTELNTANCEGFPFPETESEIVQIPTNEDNLNKMAIIRMIKNKQTTNNDKVRQDRSGFYNESEFKEYKENRAQELSESTEGVQLVSQNINSIQQKRPIFQVQKGSKQSKKSVKWADNLEW